MLKNRFNYQHTLTIEIWERCIYWHRVSKCNPQKSKGKMEGKHDRRCSIWQNLIILRWNDSRFGVSKLFQTEVNDEFVVSFSFFVTQELEDFHTSLKSSVLNQEQVLVEISRSFIHNVFLISTSTFFEKVAKKWS